MKNKISMQDLNHYKIVRKSVRDFISNCANNYDKRNKLLLDIAPQIHMGAKEFFKKSTVKTIDIDPTSKADYILDICEQNQKIVPSHSADMIMCTEVLEHVLNPFNAVKEMSRMLKKNGLLMLSTPFNFRIHGPLPDCWRFTEHGLKALLQEKFKSIEITHIPTKNRWLMPIHYRVVATKK